MPHTLECKIQALLIHPHANFPQYLLPPIFAQPTTTIPTPPNQAVPHQLTHTGKKKKTLLSPAKKKKKQRRSHHMGGYIPICLKDAESPIKNTFLSFLTGNKESKIIHAGIRGCRKNILPVVRAMGEFSLFSSPPPFFFAPTDFTHFLLPSSSSFQKEPKPCTVFRSKEGNCPVRDKKKGFFFFSGVLCAKATCVLV